jgi:dTDP-4-dehydrorhamnose reductase
VSTKLLVTGSDGLVGTNILPALRREFDVIACVESQWDITDEAQGEEFLGKTKPDVLLNLAAMTDVDGCEDRPDAAFRVNADGAGVLAGVCARLGIRMVHFSTDYVFDGTKTAPYTEEDATNPLSVYGKSKRRGEERIMASLPSAVIVRTEWIYGHGGENFITKIVKAANDRGRVEVVDDQTGSPTYAGDLAAPIVGLIRTGAEGIHHVTNSGSCTWHQFAGHIFSLLAMDVACTPVSSETFKTKARRPANSVLDCTKLTSVTKISMRSWQEALKEYLIGNESDISLRRPPVGH